MNIKTLTLFIILVTTAVYADQPDEKSVNTLIVGAESMLAGAAADGANDYAPEEIKAVGEYIARAKAFLKARKTTEAYYEMNIGVEYFRLITAKKELYIGKQKNIKPKKKNSKKTDK